MDCSFQALNPHGGGICVGQWKIRVCVNNVYCMQEMKICIWREVVLFQDEIYQVFRNIFSSCGLCLKACQHLETILWHKVSWTADEITDCNLCNKAAVTTAMLTQRLNMQCIISCIICVCDTVYTCTAFVVKMMLSLYSETHNVIHTVWNP